MQESKALLKSTNYWPQHPVLEIASRVRSTTGLPATIKGGGILMISGVLASGLGKYANCTEITFGGIRI